MSDCAGNVSCVSWRCSCPGGDWRCVPGNPEPLNPFGLVAVIFAVLLLVLIFCSP